MVIEVKSTGKYNITYKNLEYNFEGGNSYKIDEDTAKQFVESGYCTYAKEIKNDTIKSKKTNENLK